MTIEEGHTRLLVVSNRLPVTVSKNDEEKGGWSYSMSSGGLVSALSGVKTLMPFLWIGWPGIPTCSFRPDFTNC